MFKNFILCPFRVFVPKVSVYEHCLKLEFDVEIKPDAEEPGLQIVGVHVKNEKGDYIFSSDQTLDVEGPKNHFNINCRPYKGNGYNEDSVRDYSIELYFISATSHWYYDVYYEIASINNVELCVVNSYDASINERFAEYNDKFRILAKERQEMIKQIAQLKEANAKYAEAFEKMCKAYEDEQDKTFKYREFYLEEYNKNQNLIEEITALRKKKDKIKAKKFAGQKYEDTKAYREAVEASRQDVYSDTGMN